MLHDNKSLSDGFIRQRRNLIISTIFVYFIHYTTIEIDKLSIFGISFDIVKKSDDLLLLIYIIWGYFSYRYLQYFYDSGAGICKYEFKIVEGKKRSQLISPYIAEKEPEAINYENSSMNLEKKDNQYFYNGYKSREGAYGMDENRFQLEIPKVLIYKAKFKAVFEIVFLKSIFSDIYLPIILFIGVLGYVLFK